MNIHQAAAQLYTVRDYTQTPGDIAQSMKKVRAIGYEGVQVSALGPIDDDELAKILDGEGLVCCAAHEDSEQILRQPQALVERLGKLDCKRLAYPYPAGIDFSTMAGVMGLARDLNAAGNVLREAGIVFAYHNHSIEFQRVEGKLILDLIYANTDPQNLQSELDTYWVQHGGGSPQQWCRRLRDRLPMLHMKDYVITNNDEPTFAEIGAGNLDWQAIVAEADRSGCEWYLVEQDTCPGDPFDSLRKSFDYIKEALCT